MTVIDPAHQTPQRGSPVTSRLAVIARSVATVFGFEFRKSRTWKRTLVWLGVSAFPALIIFLMLYAGDYLPRPAWITAVFVMACEMVIILNAMLWVAPIVQSELEGKTWLYIVVRPWGRVGLVLGKLLNGLAWTIGAGLFALVLVGLVAWLYALPIEEIAGTASTISRGDAAAALHAQPSRRPPVRPDRSFGDGPPPVPGLNLRDLQKFPQPEEPEIVREPPFHSISEFLQTGGILAILALLSGMTYSALFCGIGCAFPKRAMLITFSYTLIFETVVAFVPAIVNG